MNTDLKNVFVAVGYGAFVGYAAMQYIKVYRNEQMKRAEIIFNEQLDILAIQEAQRVMSERIANGSYPLRSITRLQRDMETEIEFQKIIIRE